MYSLQRGGFPVPFNRNVYFASDKKIKIKDYIDGFIPLFRSFENVHNTCIVSSGVKSINKHIRGDIFRTPDRMYYFSNRNKKEYISFIGGFGEYNSFCNQINIIYSFMVQKALKNVQQKKRRYIEPSISELWVNENLLKKQTSYIKYMIVTDVIKRAQEEGIKVRSVPNFKSFFENPLEDIKSIKELKTFKKSFIESLVNSIKNDTLKNKT